MQKLKHKRKRAQQLEEQAELLLEQQPVLLWERLVVHLALRLEHLSELA